MSDSVLRVYLDPAEIGSDGYPLAWHKPWEELLEAGRDIAGDAATEKAFMFLDDGILAIKDYVRERDGHRCLRCGHPYRKGEHGNGEWSPCDKHCRHGAPVRSRYGESDWLIFTSSPPGEIARWDFDAGAEVQAQWRILTVHHLNGIKHDCRWWNLVSLCQRDHLYMQGAVVMDRPYEFEHSDWFKPFAAGFYAWKYLGEELSRKEVDERLEELLALEQRYERRPLF